MEKTMSRVRQLLIVASAVVLSASASLVGALIPASALASNGQCRWEGGPGAAGGHEYCRQEDCIGRGGLAQCTKPVGAPATPWTDAQLGPDKWAFHMCDEAAPHAAHWANWCASAGGQWIGPSVQCVGLPTDIIGGGGTITNQEERAVSISDTFVDNKYGTCDTSVSSDTGWGATVSSTMCWSGGVTMRAGISVQELRQRRYTTCNGGAFTITMLKNRDVRCPIPYKSRGSGANLQCYIPAEAVCPLGNPVSPVTGTKFLRELDYSVNGLKLERFYSSTGYHRPTGVSLSTGPDGTLRASDFWRHSYEHRLYPVSANAEIIALIERADGSTWAFDPNGRELRDHRGASAKLEVITGGWRLITGAREVETYDSAGRLVSIGLGFNAPTTLAYDAFGRLSTVTQPGGQRIEFQYNSASQVTAVVLPGNHTITYAYDAYQRPSAVTYAGGATRQYHYENAAQQWLLTGVTDENQRRFATYTYDAQGRATVSEHAGGANRYALDYQPDGSTIVTSSDGSTRTLSFSNSRGVMKPASSTAPGAGCGIVKQSMYDTNGNLASKTDFNNNQTTFAFSPTRRLETSRTEAAGTPTARTVSTQWHPTFNLPTQIDEPGRRTTLTYDTSGNLLTRTITDTQANESRTWTYTYNARGQVLTQDGPRTDVSDVTTYSYHECNYGSECGQLATIVNAAGHTTQYHSYNAHGQPTWITDANGVSTTIEYDDRQRVRSHDVGGEVTTMDYTPTGLIQRVTMPDGSYAHYTYDDAHRLIGVSDAQGNRITYTLDGAGNRTAENVYDPSNALARTRSRAYDALGRLGADVDASGNAVSYSYDLNGNLENVADPEYRLTTYAYDETNRKASAVDPMGGLTQYTYTASSEMQSVTDPRGLTTSYEYNGFGDQTRVTSPDTGVTTYEPTPGGQLWRATDARGRTVTYTYDALGRPSTATYPDQTIQYFYDEGTHSKGRLTRVVDSAGTTTWTHTSHGRVASKTQTAGTLSLTTSYGYNAAGQLITATTPSGQVVTYSYLNGQLSAISLNGTPIISSILYAPFGATAGWRWSNGTLMVREYDTNGRLTTIDSAGVYSYEFYADGTIRSWLEDTTSALSVPSGATEFSVDSDSNQLLDSEGASVRTFSYDNAGNLLSDGQSTFTYNDAGRLISSTRNSGTTNYLLNALGQRVRKTANGQSRHFVYDEAGHLIGEYDHGGVLIQETVWFGDMPIATLRPRAGAGVDVYYIHSDHLNTPRKISRPSDNVIVWRWDSDPFGTTAANQDPDGDTQGFTYNLRFPGQYYDSETGLHYNYFRDYDPKTGRYVESDPIGLKGGPNTYAYVSGDPVRLVDPFGLFCTQDFLWHYYAGGGVPIDLARVGLRDEFVNHPSVRTSVDGFKNQLRIEGIQRARSGCAGRTSGTFRADFDLKDQTITNVYGVFSCLFSVASSTFFMEGACSMVADCCNRSMTLRCTATFSIRDWFRDVCGPGCELPGGTPYLIFESFNEFMNETRSF